MSIRQGGQIIAGVTNPDWVGNLEEYTTQQIGILHPDWICFITDDDTSTLVDCYTKTACDNLFAHRDADNFTEIGTTFLSTMSIPDYTRYDNLTVLATGSSYIAPHNGWFYTKGQTNTSNSPAVIYLHGPLVDGRTVTLGGWAPNGAQGRVVSCIYPVNAGDSVELVYGNQTTNIMLTFIYANGNPGGTQI